MSHDAVLYQYQVPVKIQKMNSASGALLLSDGGDNPPDTETSMPLRICIHGTSHRCSAYLVKQASAKETTSNIIINCHIKHVAKSIKQKCVPIRAHLC